MRVFVRIEVRDLDSGDLQLLDLGGDLGLDLRLVKASGCSEAGEGHQADAKTRAGTGGDKRCDFCGLKRGSSIHQHNVAADAQFGSLGGE